MWRLVRATSTTVRLQRSITTSRVLSDQVRQVNGHHQAPKLNGSHQSSWGSDMRAPDKPQPQPVAAAAAAGSVVRVASTKMPSAWGQLEVVAYRSPLGDIIAVVSGLGNGSQVPVRVHDACLTGEVFGSWKCDCGMQLRLALKVQSRSQMGVIIYMPQEGRGIGLANKIRAYSLQEEFALDTVDANLALGLPAEMRDYAAVPHILQDLGVSSILLMTNNPYKVEQVRLSGVVVEGTLPVVVSPPAKATGQYLDTKRRRMGHVLPEVSGHSAAPHPSLNSPALELLTTLRSDIHQHSTDLPFTLLSFAASLDGFIGGVRSLAGGQTQRYPVPLSGKASSTLTQHLRGSVDAILVGLGTVLADNPRLDVREDGAGPSPRPVVLDSHLNLPPDCRLLTHHAKGGRLPVLVLCTKEAEASRAEELRQAGAVVVHCQADDRGRVCLRSAWARMREASIGSVMVEGGAEVIRGLLSTPLVHRLVVTQTGVVLGDGVRWAAPGGTALGRGSNFTLGQDAIFTWQPHPPESEREPGHSLGSGRDRSQGTACAAD